MLQIKTIGDQIFWIYANVGMAHAALRDGVLKYTSKYYMIRARLLRDLTSGKIRISSFFQDETAKIGMHACCYCGSESNLSLDHVIPRNKLGSDSPENLLPACRHCNSAKGSRDVLLFLQSQGLFPSLYLLRRYLKLFYQYCSINELLSCPLADAADLNLPFELSMLDCNAYLAQLKRLNSIHLENCTPVDHFDKMKVPSAASKTG